MFNNRFVGVLFAAWALSVPLTSFAADAPDAGRLLREQPKFAPQPFTPPLVAPTEKPVEPVREPQGPTLQVKGFRFQGVTLVSEADLKVALADGLGKTLTVDELTRLTNRVTAFYASKGYVARAVLPPQDIEDGIVLIIVIEAKVSSLIINNSGERVQSERAGGFIENRLQVGESLSLETLGEALNILNDQPGVEAVASLGTGSSEGETAVIVTTADKPLTLINSSVSNEGSRATGEARAVFSASLQNPTGYFDEATLLLAETQGSSFVSANYSLAVGSSGLRVGANTSYLDYQVVQDSLKAAESSGHALTYDVFAFYPLYRLRMSSLGITGSVGQKQLKDFTVAGEVGNRQVTTASLGLQGERQDELGGAGITRFGLALVVGDSDQRNEGARFQDASSRKAFGSFSKVGYSLGRQQQLAPLWALNFSLRGQIALDNLDSSERFSLGGVSGVRAYPSGEAGGDEGHLFSADLVRQFSPALFGRVFVDAGWIRDNHDTWDGWDAGNPDSENTYHLAGLGAGIDWKVHENFSLSASLAKPIGSNRGEDANGKDSDGRDQDLRGWVSLVVQF